MVPKVNRFSRRGVPGYLDLGPADRVVSMARIFGLSDMPFRGTMEPNHIVEFYSR